jgi:hypothetical protein
LGLEDGGGALGRGGVGGKGVVEGDEDAGGGVGLEGVVDGGAYFGLGGGGGGLGGGREVAL